MLENDINDSYDYYNDNSSYYSDSNDGNSKSDTDNILNTPPKEVIEVKILKIFQKLHRNSLFELAWIINKTFFYNHLQNIKLKKLHKICVKVRLSHFYVPTKNLLSFAENSEIITSIGISTNGQYLAIGRRNNNAVIYGLNRLKKNYYTKALLTISRHTNWISTVSYSPDDNYLATGSWDCSILIHGVNLVTKHDCGKLIIKITYNFAITSVNYSPLGDILVAGSLDSKIIVYDINMNSKNFGKKLYLLNKHTGIINSICFSHYGGYVGSASDDYTSNIFEKIGKWSALKSFDFDNPMLKFKFKSYVKALSFISYDEYIAIGCADSIIYIYGVNKQNLTSFNKEIMKLTGHHHAILSLSYSYITNFLATGCVNGRIIIYYCDIKDKNHFLKEIGRIDIKYLYNNVICLSPLNYLVISNSNNNNITLYF